MDSEYLEPFQCSSIVTPVPAALSLLFNNNHYTDYKAVALMFSLLSNNHAQIQIEINNYPSVLHACIYWYHKVNSSINVAWLLKERWQVCMKSHMHASWDEAPATTQTSEARLPDNVHAACMSAIHACRCRMEEMSEHTRQGFPVWGDPGTARAKASSAAASAALHRITDQDTHMPQPHSAYISVPHSSREYSHPIYWRQTTMTDTVSSK